MRLPCFDFAGAVIYINGIREPGLISLPGSRALIRLARTAWAI